MILLINKENRYFVNCFKGWVTTTNIAACAYNFNSKLTAQSFLNKCNLSEFHIVELENETPT